MIIKPCLGLFNILIIEFKLVNKNPKSTEIKNLGNLSMLFQKIYM